MKTTTLSLLAAALGLALCAPAQADDWFVRAGAAHVKPKSGNGSVAGGAFNVTIDSNTQLGLVIGRKLNANWAVELLAATPFRHTVALNGADAVDFKHLPPTLSLQYDFAPDAPVSAFAGLGVNYTWTYSESTYGPVSGARVSLGNSWGLAAQVGGRVRLGDKTDLVVEARWIDIDADVKLNGAKIGTANVDPMVYGLYVSRRF